MWASVCFDQSKIMNKLFFLVRFNLFKSLFQTPFSLSDSNKHHPLFFVVFNQIVCRVFLSPKASMSIIPFLFHLFSVLHAFFHALKGYFRTMHKLGFLIFQALLCEIDQWVLLIYCYIHDLCWLIWSIWDFVMNSKF